MRYAQIHPTLRHALGTHEAFRRIGFRPEEIFVHRNPNGELLVVVVRSERQFAVTVGTVDWDQTTFEVAWRNLIEAVRARKVPDWTLQRCFDRAPPKRDTVGFLLALRDKGLLPSGATLS